MSRKSVIAAELQAEETPSVGSPLRRSSRRRVSTSQETAVEEVLSETKPTPRGRRATTLIEEDTNTSTPKRQSKAASKVQEDAKPQPTKTRGRRTSTSSETSEQAPEEKKQPVRGRRTSTSSEASEINEEKKVPVRSRRRSTSVESDIEILPKSTRKRTTNATTEEAEVPKSVRSRRGASSEKSPSVEPEKRSTRGRRSSSDKKEVEEEVAPVRRTTRGRRMSANSEDFEEKSNKEKKPSSRRSSVDEEEAAEQPNVTTPIRTRRRPSITENAVILDPIHEASPSKEKAATQDTEKLVSTKKTDLDLSVINESVAEDDELEKLSKKMEDQPPTPKKRPLISPDLRRSPSIRSSDVRRSPRLSKSPDVRRSPRLSNSPEVRTSKISPTNPLESKVNESKTEVLVEQSKATITNGLDGSFSFHLNASVLDSSKEEEPKDSSVEPPDENLSKSNVQEATHEPDELNSSKASNSSDKENISTLSNLKEQQKTLLEDTSNKIIVGEVKEVIVARISNVFRPKMVENSFCEPMEVDELPSSINKSTFETTTANVEESVVILNDVTVLDCETTNQLEHSSVGRDIEPKNESLVDDSFKLGLTLSDEQFEETTLNRTDTEQKENSTKIEDETESINSEKKINVPRSCSKKSTSPTVTASDIDSEVLELRISSPVLCSKIQLSQDSPDKTAKSKYSKHQFELVGRESKSPAPSHRIEEVSTSPKIEIKDVEISSQSGESRNEKTPSPVMNKNFTLSEETQSSGMPTKQLKIDTEIEEIKEELREHSPLGAKSVDYSFGIPTDDEDDIFEELANLEDTTAVKLEEENTTRTRSDLEIELKDKDNRTSSFKRKSPSPEKGAKKIKMSPQKSVKDLEHNDTELSTEELTQNDIGETLNENQKVLPNPNKKEGANVIDDKTELFHNKSVQGSTEEVSSQEHQDASSTKEKSEDINRELQNVENVGSNWPEKENKPSEEQSNVDVSYVAEKEFEENKDIETTDTDINKCDFLIRKEDVISENSRVQKDAIQLEDDNNDSGCPTALHTSLEENERNKQKVDSPIMEANQASLNEENSDNEILVEHKLDQIEADSEMQKESCEIAQLSNLENSLEIREKEGEIKSCVGADNRKMLCISEDSILISTTTAINEETTQENYFDKSENSNENTNELDTNSSKILDRKEHGKNLLEYDTVDQPPLNVLSEEDQDTEANEKFEIPEEISDVVLEDLENSNKELKKKPQRHSLHGVYFTHNAKEDTEISVIAEEESDKNQKHQKKNLLKVSTAQEEEMNYSSRENTKKSKKKKYQISTNRNSAMEDPDMMESEQFEEKIIELSSGKKDETKLVKPDFEKSCKKKKKVRTTENLKSDEKGIDNATVEDYITMSEQLEKNLEDETKFVKPDFKKSSKKKKKMQYAEDLENNDKNVDNPPEEEKLEQLEKNLIESSGGKKDKTLSSKKKKKAGSTQNFNNDINNSQSEEESVNFDNSKETKSKIFSDDNIVNENIENDAVNYFNKSDETSSQISKKKKVKTQSTSAEETKSKNKKDEKGTFVIRQSLEEFENSKMDEYLSKKLEELGDESSDEESYERNSNLNEFIDDMAEEGEEDTPSEGSNDIIEVGESIGSSDSEVFEEDDYEEDSFVCDDEDEKELLSGEEYDLDLDEEKGHKSRIINLKSEHEDGDKIVIPRKEKPPLEPKRRSRIISVSSDSSDEEAVVSEETLNKVVTAISSPHKTIEVKEQIIRKRNSSITIQENLSVESIKDNTLTDRITKVVNSFCSSLNEPGGKISLNLSIESITPETESSKLSASRKSVEAQFNKNELQPQETFVISTPKTSSLSKETQSTHKPSEQSNSDVFENESDSSQIQGNSDLSRRKLSCSDSIKDVPSSEQKIQKKRLSRSLEKLDDDLRKTKKQKVSSNFEDTKKNLTSELKKSKKKRNKRKKEKTSKIQTLASSIDDLRTGTFNLMSQLVTDVKNRPVRTIKPSSSAEVENSSWIVEANAKNIKPSTTLVTNKEKETKFHPKDFKNQMLFGSSSHVRRIGTKALLKKKGA